MTTDTKALALRVADELEGIAGFADAWKAARCNLRGLTPAEARALAALLREAAEDWRPIESAPKDGKVILLANESIAFDGWWDNDLSEWIDGDTNGFGEFITYQPVAWRPLPAPPAAGGKDGE